MGFFELSKVDRVGHRGLKSYLKGNSSYGLMTELSLTTHEKDQYIKHSTDKKL